MAKRKMGCFAKALIALLVVVVIIGISVIVVINLTPRHFGLADISIGGTSLSQLGLADVKLIDLIKMVSSLTSVEETALVKNEPIAETESPKAESNIGGSSIATNEDGKPQYISIISSDLIYDAQYLKEYEDTTLAYIFSQIIVEANGKSDVDENIKYLSDLNAECREISISKATNGSADVRFVASVDVSIFLGQITDKLGALSNVIPIPQKVYLVAHQNATVDSSGRLVMTSTSVTINDSDDALGNAIFSVLNEKNPDDNVDTKAFIGKALGDGFAEFISRLGVVGTASVDSSDIVNSSVELSNAGLKDGSITVITKTA